MAGLFDLEFHEKKIKEYQPPLAKLGFMTNSMNNALYRVTQLKP